MEAELEKMRVYEQSYHTQEKKFQSSLDRIDVLTTEKCNVDAAHTDLIIDFNQLRYENEKLLVENTTNKSEVEILTKQVAHLKKSVIMQFNTPRNQEGHQKKINLHPGQSDSDSDSKIIQLSDSDGSDDAGQNDQHEANLEPEFKVSP